MTSHASVRDEQAPTHRRPADLALWVVQVITSLTFLLAALAKITGVAAVVSVFDAIGFGDWFRYLIAALEIAGAVALLVPVLSGLTALAFVALMVGAAVVHLAVVGAGVGSVVVPLLLALVVAWGRRRTVPQLVDALRRAK